MPLVWPDSAMPHALDITRDSLGMGSERTAVALIGSFHLAMDGNGFTAAG